MKDHSKQFRMALGFLLILVIVMSGFSSAEEAYLNKFLEQSISDLTLGEFILVMVLLLLVLG